MSSHYTEDEWRGYFAAAGLEVEAAESFVEYLDFDRGWRAPAAKGRRLRKCGSCSPTRPTGDGWNYPYLVFKARKSA